jgi:hypothetical protein
MKTSSCFLAAAALVLIPSCVAAPEGDEHALGEATEAAMACDPKCGANGKNAGFFWLPATQMFYEALAAAPLSQFPSSANLPTDGRDEIIRNAIECALTQKQTVVDDQNIPRTGWWGIAPDWESRPLSADARRWVTGCMVQRLNAYGKTVNILPEGNTPALYKDPSWEAVLPFDESIVWGDVFTPSAGPHVVYACWGSDLDATCGEPAKYLNTRICDQAKDNCNLQIMGPCSKVCDTGTTGYPFCKNPDGTLDDHTVHVQTDARKYCSFGE